MEEGKLAKWLVKEGDKVKSGQVLAEIETDKATMEFEAVDEGRIGKILVPAGAENVKVNAPIAVLLGEGEDANAVVNISAAMKSIQEAVKNEAPKAAAAPAPVAKAPEAAKPKPANDGKRIFVSPLARRIAAQKGIDLAALSGTGPRGRIVKSDIENAKPGQKPAAASVGAATGMSLPDARLYYKKENYEEIPHDGMRKTIAKRLTAAKMLIPHYYLTIDCRLDSLMATRAKLNEDEN